MYLIYLTSVVPLSHDIRKIAFVPAVPRVFDFVSLSSFAVKRKQTTNFQRSGEISLKAAKENFGASGERVKAHGQTSPFDGI